MIKQIYDYSPDELTYELCLESVKKDGWTIKFVPDKFKTEELCIAAVKRDGLAIRYIKNQTYRICIISLKHNVDNIVHISDYDMFLRCKKWIKRNHKNKSKLMNKYKNY